MDEIIDEDGVKWYPLNWFVQKILRKKDKRSLFRDGKTSKYMKVIEYSSDRVGMTTPKKAWCINEKGIKFLLKNMRINKKGSKMTYKAREKGFFEACLYFNVKKPLERLEPTFIKQIPNLDDYDFWSATCLEYDTYDSPFEPWKFCPECHYYYPFREAYFGAKPSVREKCLQCQGKNFRCKNKIIQYIHENGGDELLFQMRNYAPAETIVKELNFFIKREGRKSEN